MTTPGSTFPWHRVLPVAGLVVSLLLVALAVLTEYAWEGRRELLVEGRLMRLAHQIEGELREAGPGVAESVLTRALAEDGAAGLRLLGISGEVESTLGDATGAPRMEIELFLGREWAFVEEGGGEGPGLGRGGMGRGRRRLQLFAPVAGPGRWPERLLLPTSLLVAVLVTALASLGGRLLLREQERAGEDASRRRLEAVATAGAGLAHQLRTPLATAKGSLQLLQERHGSEERFAVVVGQLLRLEQLLDDLLDYARPPAPERERVEVAGALRQAADRDGRIRLAGGERAGVVQVDPGHLQAILDNLLDNALAVTDEAGEVTLLAERGRGTVELRVEDRGPGPGRDPEHLFEPYVTSRPGGTGLGLPIARALAEANRGHLRLAPREGGGTLAILTLPQASGEEGG